MCHVFMCELNCTHCQLNATCTSHRIDTKLKILVEAPMNVRANYRGENDNELWIKTSFHSRLPHSGNYYSITMQMARNGTEIVDEICNTMSSWLYQQK